MNDEQYPFEICEKEVPQDFAGKIGWRCPSNIAIVKYWGKYGRQLPKNASLSFTLSNAHTDTTFEYRYRPSSLDAPIALDFTFEGKKNEAFGNKIIKFLTSTIDFYPFLKNIELKISSSNSFPHSSGIASSASAMAAIAMGIGSIEAHLNGNSTSEYNRDKVSYLARLGSGSASRSVYPTVALWGNHELVSGSSNLYAKQISDIHPVFTTYHDDILIVSAAEKAVSSTAGHALMDGNVYAEARYSQANQRISQLLEIMKSGDVDAFGKLAEDEAMTLHALMMCSDPSYVLMEPGTLDMISRIRAYRAKTKVPVYFTLDAGPNIHLLYPHEVYDEVQEFITKELLPVTADGVIIKDKVGNGPEKII